MMDNREYCRIQILQGGQINPVEDRQIDPISIECWLNCAHTETCLNLRNGEGRSLCERPNEIFDPTPKNQEQLRLILCQPRGANFHVFNEFPLSRQWVQRVIGSLLSGQKHIKPGDLCDGKPHFTKISTDQGHIGFVLVTAGQQNEQCGLVILHDPKSGLTKGILHCRRFEPHVELLEHAISLAGHPMLLLFLLANYVIDISSSQVGDQLTTITQRVEVETGQNLYGFGKKVNRLTINYGKTTRETNMLLTNLEWTKLKLESLTSLYDRFQDYCNEIVNITDAHRQDEMRLDSKNLKELVHHQQSVTHNQLLYIDSIRERAKNELEVMYNFVAQRDTSIVNAIGILTFVFFPGTFVASIFAMPLITWYPNKAEGQTRLHKQFWLYPVVTLSFTFAIVIVLVPWVWRANQIPRNSQKKVKIQT